METSDYFDGPSDYDAAEEFPRDTVIDEARVAVEDYITKHQRTTFYLKQLQVIFERTFYHWITAKAISFHLTVEKARTYHDREWTETGHDLDFIFERDGVAYGCEIKNRFEYIGREEMRIKMRMCQHLGLTPLFIMRAAPKSYLHEIWQVGGLFKIFQTHIFPYGLESLVQQIREEFVGLPVDCPRDLPNTILDRILELHTRRLRNKA